SAIGSPSLEVQVVDVVESVGAQAQAYKGKARADQGPGDVSPHVLTALDQQRPWIVELLHRIHVLDVLEQSHRPFDFVGDLDFDLRGRRSRQLAGQIVHRALGDEPPADQDAYPVTNLLHLVKQ